MIMLDIPTQLAAPASVCGERETMGSHYGRGTAITQLSAGDRWILCHGNFAFIPRDFQKAPLRATVAQATLH